jgi:hypothetical protein
VCKGSDIKAPYANQIGTVPVPYKAIGADGERESNSAFALNFGIFLGERPLKFFVFEMRLQQRDEVVSSTATACRILA